MKLATVVAEHRPGKIEWAITLAHILAMVLIILTEQCFGRC